MADAGVGTVYVLRHPETRDVVYVGHTVKPLEKRLDAHISASRMRYGKHGLKRWLRKLGRRPLIEPLVSAVPGDLLRKLETRAIISFRSEGVTLLNETLPIRGCKHCGAALLMREDRR